MSWSFKFVRPKIRALVEENVVADNLWHNCSASAQMLFHREPEEHFNVFHTCEHKLLTNARRRLELWFNKGAYTRVGLSSVTVGLLKFHDTGTCRARW
ncbi:MAG: hypothetical protein OSB67_12305 [Alphaproteobacteria bacterium]|nr:hypothetical protein [Alphaproteobacteria bacterium]